MSVNKEVKFLSELIFFLLLFYIIFFLDFKENYLVYQNMPYKHTI